MLKLEYKHGVISWEYANVCSPFSPVKAVLNDGKKSLCQYEGILASKTAQKHYQAMGSLLLLEVDLHAFLVCFCHCRSFTTTDGQRMGVAELSQLVNDERLNMWKRKCKGKKMGEHSKTK